MNIGRGKRAYFQSEEAPVPMSKTPSDQKRGAFRLTAQIDAKFFPVMPQVARPVSEDIPLSKWLIGSINDISVSGARLTGPLSLGEKAHIAVHFTLPSDFLKDFVNEELVNEASPFGERTRSIKHKEPDFIPMELLCKVIREAYNAETKVFQYHVSFVRTPDAVDKELNRFVTLQQRYQLKNRAHVRQSS